MSETPPTMLIPEVAGPELFSVMSPLPPVVLILTWPSLTPLSVKLMPVWLTEVVLPVRVIGPVLEVMVMRLGSPALDIPEEFEPARMALPTTFMEPA